MRESNWTCGNPRFLVRISRFLARLGTNQCRSVHPVSLCKGRCWAEDHQGAPLAWKICEPVFSPSAFVISYRRLRHFFGVRQCRLRCHIGTTFQFSMDSANPSEWGSCFMGFTCKDSEMFIHILHSGTFTISFFSGTTQAVPNFQKLKLGDFILNIKRVHLLLLNNNHTRPNP